MVNACVHQDIGEQLPGHRDLGVTLCTKRNVEQEIGSPKKYQ
jgi:hypothetical protein